jgi:hypothetical protein
MSSKKKVASMLVTLAAAATLAACGGDDEPAGEQTANDQAEMERSAPQDQQRQTPPPKVPIATILVNKGKPLGGPKELEFDAGETVRFQVATSAADEVHVHGYDVTRRLRPDKATVISFPADIEGIFEVELHGSGELIAELQVNP